MRKVLGLSLLALGILGITALGISEVRAEEINFPPIVQKIAERFNLNPEEVNEVFEEVHQERAKDMGDCFEDRLDELLAEGTITEEQKELILAKKAELQELRSEAKDLTPEEMRTEMEESREELEKWAEENGIDIKLFGMFGGFGHGPHKGFGDRPNFQEPETIE